MIILGNLGNLREFRISEKVRRHHFRKSEGNFRKSEKVRRFFFVIDLGNLGSFLKLGNLGAP